MTIDTEKHPHRVFVGDELAGRFSNIFAAISRAHHLRHYEDRHRWKGDSVVMYPHRKPIEVCIVSPQGRMDGPDIDLSFGRAIA